VHSFIKGINLEYFPSTLDNVDILVTFYGRCFDVPMLSRVFPQIDFSRFLHIDLCFLLRKLGQNGGLKQIERRLGIRRSEGTDGLTGFDAVQLWQAYRSGSKEALDLLVRYNTEDIVNLHPLMEYAYKNMRAQIFPGESTP
jgi:uncharacterized protein YprB with RNaseH-like and TPR domain